MTYLDEFTWNDPTETSNGFFNTNILKCLNVSLCKFSARQILPLPCRKIRRFLFTLIAVFSDQHFMGISGPLSEEVRFGVPTAVTAKTLSSVM
jgi:hypothetical protein